MKFTSGEHQIHNITEFPIPDDWPTFELVKRSTITPVDGEPVAVFNDEEIQFEYNADGSYTMLVYGPRDVLRRTIPCKVAEE